MGGKVRQVFRWVHRLLSWQTILRALGVLIVLVELRQVLMDKPLDQSLLLLAAGLLGVTVALKKGNGGSG